MTCSSPRRQCDLVLHGACPAADEFGVPVPQQRCNRRIVGGGQGGEAVDAFAAGTACQLSQQLGAQSPALPVVDDGDGDLGGLWVFSVADVAGDAHAAPVGVVQRAERLVIVVVDLGEVAQLRGGQFFLSCQEPHLAGSGTEPCEAVGQQRRVSALDLPYQHL